MTRSARLVLAWVDLYSRGLPPAIRCDRLDEITGDLWEQHAADGAGLATQLAIASRCVRGMPADLSWRRSEQRRIRGVTSFRRTAWRWSRRGLFAAACLSMLAFHAFGALPLFGVYPIDMETWPNVEVYSAMSASLGGALVLGLSALRRLPRTGASCVTVAVLGTAAYHYWAVFAFGPAAAIIVTVVVRRARAATSGRHATRI
jgi:hypothetical protein